MRLDEELAAAASQADDHAGGPSSPAAASSSPPRRATGNIGLLIGLLVVVAGVVSMFLFGFKEAAIYATPVDALMQNQAKYSGRKVRVEGELVPGTLVKRDSPCEYRFTVHGPESQLPVRYAQCIIPDTFRDVPGGGVQVTIEGNLASDGGFDASLVMAKCTSKYDPKTHEMSGNKSVNELIN